MAGAAPRPGAGTLRATRPGRAAGDPARSVGPGADGRGRQRPEPDRRDRPLAARDRGPRRSGRAGPSVHGTAGLVDDGGGVIVAAVTAFRGTASPLHLEPRRSLRIERPRIGPAVRPGPGHPDAPGAPTRLGDGRLADRTRSQAGAASGARHRSRAHSSTWPWRPTPRSWSTGRPSRRASFRPTATHGGSAASPSSHCRWPRAASMSRSSTRRRGVRCPRGCTSVPPTDDTCRRSATAKRSIRPQRGHRSRSRPGRHDLRLRARSVRHRPARRHRARRGRPWLRLSARAAIDRGRRRRALRSSWPWSPSTWPAGDGWVAADCHVHFISPSSALLQAQAEGVGIVNLLATQWGDHHTSVVDLPIVALQDPTARHLVVMGSENRQNMLGHIGLLGASEAVLPMASGGAPEGRLGDPLGWLMADWADAVHAQHGLAVAVHFPLPYAEVAADIVAGKIEAVEMQALTPGVDGPSIREWYRFLDCGFRLPIVGGTDKMTAEIPLGSDPHVRAARRRWSALVRAMGGCGPIRTNVRDVGSLRGDRRRRPAARRHRAARPWRWDRRGQGHGHGGAAGDRWHRADPRRHRHRVGRRASRHRPHRPRRASEGHARWLAGRSRHEQPSSSSRPSPPPWGHTARRSTSRCPADRPSTPMTRPSSRRSSMARGPGWSSIAPVAPDVDRGRLHRLLRVGPGHARRAG